MKEFVATNLEVTAVEAMPGKENSVTVGDSETHKNAAVAEAASATVNRQGGLDIERYI